MGYGSEQVRELETMINGADCDSVLIATPIDLRRIADIRKPSTRVRYELQEIGLPTLRDTLARLMRLEPGLEINPAVYPHLKDAGLPRGQSAWPRQ
jgi:predicted GTPase